MGNSWQLGQFVAWQAAGMVGAVVLVVGGFWVLWLARHRIEDQRVRLPMLGVVGHPTSLVVGLCLLGWGYHAAAYSLLPAVSLVALPRDLWWVLVVVSVVAVVGSLVADVLENRGDGGGE